MSNSNEFNCLTWFRPPIFGIDRKNGYKGVDGPLPLTAQWSLGFSGGSAPSPRPKLDGIRFLLISMSVSSLFVSSQNRPQPTWLNHTNWVFIDQKNCLDIWIVGFAPAGVCLMHFERKNKAAKTIFFAATLFFITLKISINSALTVPSHSFRHGRTVPGLSQGLSPRTKVKKRVCRHVRNQKSDYRLKRFIVDLFLFSLNNDVNFVVTKEKWRKRKASRDYTGH